ncbi:acyltransferase family protein [Streptomyces sp. NPDC055037]
MSAVLSTESGPRARLTSLTGVRFIAAFMVFMFHAGLVQLFDNRSIGDTFLRIFSKTGWIGVSFFFVLSGFVLTWSARSNDTAPAFWRRRFAKILPNHLVTFVVALVLFASVATPVTTQLLNFVLLHAWVPDVNVYFSLNKANWSLACESVFYLLFPFLHARLLKIRTERLWWWAGGLMAVIMALPALALAVLPAEPTLPAPDDPAPAAVYWFLYVLPPVRVLDFLLGMVLARIVLTGRWAGFRVLPLTLLFAACYVVSLQLPASFGLGAATIVPVALLIPAVAQLDVSGRPSLLRHPVAVWLGEISFAFYLTQWLVLPGAMSVLGTEGDTYPTWAAVGLLVLWLAVSLLLSWALYVGVERPAMRRFSRGRRSRAAATRKSTVEYADAGPGSRPNDPAGP